MKELTIEEKAKRYDEAFKEASVAHKDGDRHLKATLERIFPELKESEDEKIRKEILNYLYDVHDDDEERASWIAWLEKQCGHAKFINGIQVGDKVTRNEDGVLVNLSQLNRVAKPADKQGEQKTVFEMKTPEESLGIDSDTYNNIIDECIYSEQKPTWSEEDEKLVKNLISTLSNLYARNLIEKETKEKYTNLLKSLKDRVQTQPKSDWGEEDEKMLQNILECLKKGWRKLPTDILKYESWLKSLRPQNTWKPSDEQMEALDDFIYAKYPNVEKHGAAVKSLYQDLKKL